MENKMQYLVSNFDIQKKFKKSKKISVIIYSKLNAIKSIMDIVPYQFSAWILQTSVRSGHWTCICRNNNEMYYFDSYGVAHDGELTKI